MTIEEKAKAYDEALKRAIKHHNKDGLTLEQYETIDIIFPELKESKNEKMIKSMTRLVKAFYDCNFPTPEGFERKDMIAWLEKQGEQRPADKVEPKFKVGDWITNGDYTWKIAEVKPLDYILQSQDGNIVDDTISHVDEQFHSFTIQDAKDGDVIACENGRIGIFKCLNDNLFSSYCFIDNEGWFCGDEGQVHMLDTIICGEIYPATKEQRDTLMKAMTNAGYTFDFEKKELKLLITNGGDFESENCEQKHADTVEQKCEESKTKIFDAPTPFEDKLYAFVAACEFLAIPSKIEFIFEHSQEILDAAREQIGKEQSSTWSKKDEEMRLTVLQDLQNIKDSYPNVNVEPEFNWLKSLKDRYTWKPSDKQMKALNAINVIGGISYAGQGQELVTLYNDLKKLIVED